MNIIYPVFTLLILHFLVLSYMFNNRVKEMKANRVHPEKLKLRSNTAVELKNSCAADNFLNLFEMPVVFYVLSVLAIASNKYTNSTVIIADRKSVV